MGSDFRSDTFMGDYKSGVINLGHKEGAFRRYLF